MPQNHDYIPKTDADLLTFVKNMYAYALAHASRWGVPSPQAMLEASVTEFETAFGVFSNPNHGKVDTLNKNEAKTRLIRALRSYIQGYIARNPSVSDEDKEKMGLPLRDSTPTRHPAPEVKPEIAAEPSGRGQHYEDLK